MKIIFNLASLILLISLAACDGGDDETAVDTDPATTADTDTDEPPSTPLGDNEWGSPCGDGLPDCPATQECAFPPVPDGSTTQGYCSPVCSEDSDCTDGFFGPGSPSCFIPPVCLISCDRAFEDGTCPEGLTCLSTGGPTNACGIPAQ